MPGPRTGFTLLEVLIALVVLTVGVVGLSGTLTPLTELAREGKAQGRVALLLAARADSLRAQVAASGPACLAPPAGRVLHAGGPVESWTIAPDSGSIGVLIEAAYSDRHGLHADTLITAVPCP